MKVLPVKSNNPALQVLFDELNVLHFEGKLKRIPLRLAGANYYGGMFYPQWAPVYTPKDGRPTHIMLAKSLLNPKTPKSLRSVLLHEMIHYWLWFRFSRQGRSMNTDVPRLKFSGGHGPRFDTIEQRLQGNDPILRPAPALGSTPPAPEQMVAVG